MKLSTNCLVCFTPRVPEWTLMISVDVEYCGCSMVCIFSSTALQCERFMCREVEMYQLD